MTWLAGVAASVFEWVLGGLITWIKDYLAAKAQKKQEELDNRKANDEYFKVISNPNSTREERKLAEDKYLNS